MLERMHHAMERIDELNKRFAGMSPRRGHRDDQSFRQVLRAAQGSATTPGTTTSETTTNKPAPSPLAAMAPAINTAPRGAERYADLINRYASQNGLDPALVTRLIEVESNFDPRSVSRRGAQGLMQLMPGTAAELGVENPLDPESNIAGGTRYLADLLQRYGGNLTLALAGYNAGPTAVDRHGGVPPFQETQQFVTKILGNQKDPGPR